MENVRFQKDVHVILSEAARKKAPAGGPQVPAKEPDSESSPEPSPAPETSSAPTQTPDLGKGVDDLLALFQEYAASMQAFYGEIKNGAEALKGQILAAVRDELSNAQAQGAVPDTNPTAVPVKPRRK